MNNSLYGRSVFALMLLSCTALVSVGPQVAHGDAVDEVDYVELAARLFADGHLNRAGEALSNVEASSDGVDQQRYFMLAGLIALRQQQFERASHMLAKAIATPAAASLGTPNGRTTADQATQSGADPQLFVHLARARFALGRYRGALSALEAGGEPLLSRPNAHQLRIQSHHALGEFDAAIEGLSAAERRFPQVAEFQRMHVLYLIELGLYQDAAQLGRAYLTREGVGAQAYVAIGEALRRGRRYALAAEVLETAHLRFPEHETVMLALAHVHVDMDQKFSAAMVLEGAARIQPKFTVQAAEMYRQARRSQRALLLNARVADQVEKFRQRLSILIDQQRFELVATMAPTLQRLGLLKDDQIRYAMAYGFFKIGDYRNADQYLRGIADPGLFESAGGLRRAMQACAPTDWDCL